MLAADTFRVKIVSGDTAFHDAFAALDGNRDGTAGDSYVTSFAIGKAAPTAISVGDLVLGPGMSTSAASREDEKGLAVTFSSVGGVKSITFVVEYDPALLTITGAQIGERVPSQSTLRFETERTTDGRARAVVTLTSPTTLPAGRIVLANLIATVPAAAAYGKVEVLHISVRSVNGAAATVASDDGIHVVGARRDANGDQRLNGDDKTLLDRFARGLDSGFSAWPLIDPVLIASQRRTDSERDDHDRDRHDSDARDNRERDDRHCELPRTVLDTSLKDDRGNVGSSHPATTKPTTPPEQTTTKPDDKKVADTKVDEKKMPASTLPATPVLVRLDRQLADVRLSASAGDGKNKTAAVNDAGRHPRLPWRGSQRCSRNRQGDDRSLESHTAERFRRAAKSNCILAMIPMGRNTALRVRHHPIGKPDGW